MNEQAMEIYLTMPYGYEIARHKDSDYPYSLLKNGWFLFSAKTERECFDAMSKAHAYMVDNGASR